MHLLLMNKMAYLLGQFNSIIILSGDDCPLKTWRLLRLNSILRFSGSPGRIKQKTLKENTTLKYEVQGLIYNRPIEAFQPNGRLLIPQKAFFRLSRYHACLWRNK